MEDLQLQEDQGEDLATTITRQADHDAEKLEADGVGWIEKWRGAAMW